MVQDRLGIDPAGGIDRAHLGQQRSELVQRAEILRRPVQDADKGLLRFLPPVQRAQQYRALDFGRHRHRLAAGATRQQIVELTQPRLLRQPRRPAALVRGVRRGSRFLVSVRSRGAAAFEGSIGALSADSRAVAYRQNRGRFVSCPLELPDVSRAAGRNTREARSRLGRGRGPGSRQDFVYQQSSWFGYLH